MSRLEFSLPVPITVTYQRNSRSKRNELKTHVSREFTLPSYASHEVALVAQWTQSWCEDSDFRPTDVILGGDNWLVKLREADCLVALVEKDGNFYAPVRVREGEFQHLVTAASADEAVRMINRPHTPFGHQSIYPPHMYIGQHNIREGSAAFTSTDLPEGQWHVETNEEKRSATLLSYLENNYIFVDGILFSRVDEPRLALDCNYDRAGLSITTQSDGPTLTTRYRQFYRLDELERVRQLIDEHWQKDQQIEKFAGLLCTCTDALSPEMEIDEGLRLVNCHYAVLGRSLNSLDWDIAGPWFEIKELLKQEVTEENLEKMFDAFQRSVKALENNSEVDVDWRDSVVLYGSLACDRWNYRPMRSAARTL